MSETQDAVMPAEQPDSAAVSPEVPGSGAPAAEAMPEKVAAPAELPESAAAPAGAEEEPAAEETAEAAAGETAEETAEAEEAESAEEDPAQRRARLCAGAEAILFTMGESVELGDLAQALEIDKREAQALLEEMTESYEASERGIRIVRLEDSYQLCTKKEQYPVLIRIASAPKKINLTEVLMETLSIIAYKQPVTRMEIEKIRGVKCDHAVNRLIEFNLVEEVGRLDAPGRPILLGTTEEFLRHFGTESIDNLPAISPVQVEDFKAEAEEEVDLKLRV